MAGAIMNIAPATRPESTGAAIAIFAKTDPTGAQDLGRAASCVQEPHGCHPTFRRHTGKQ